MTILYIYIYFKIGLHIFFDSKIGLQIRYLKIDLNIFLVVIKRGILISVLVIFLFLFL